MRPSPADPQVVVITGGSSGVGRATAHAFASRRCRIAVLSHNPLGLAATASEIEAHGGVALAIELDVVDAGAVDAAAERVEAELGPIDVWVNAAMATVFGPVEDISPAEFRRATEVTYLGTVHGTMAALRHMRIRNRGTIVQVGSTLSYRAVPFQTPYCGAKFAVRGFTESLRTELRREASAIHVAEVHLSAVNSPHFVVTRSRQPAMSRPVPPLFTPEVAADGVVWAATHRRRELWVGWPAVVGIVAGKLSPGLGDRVLAWRGVEWQLGGDLRPDRPDNLYVPVPFDPGTSGPYAGRSWGWPAQRWLTGHRREVSTLLAVLGAAAMRRRMTNGDR